MLQGIESATTVLTDLCFTLHTYKGSYDICKTCSKLDNLFYHLSQNLNLEHSVTHVYKRQVNYVYQQCSVFAYLF